MLTWLALRGIKGYVIIGVSILGMGLGIFYAGYSKGVMNTTLDYEAKMLKERNRVAKANQDAKDTERIRLSRLAKAESDRDALLKELHDQAVNDPNGSNPALGPDSLHRLDRIR